MCVRTKEGRVGRGGDFFPAHVTMTTLISGALGEKGWRLTWGDSYV